MTDKSALRQFANRIGNMFSRGSVASVKATTRMQTLQVNLLDEEVKDRLEHFEPYGFTSHPKKGAEAAVVFLDGDRSHGIVLVVADRRYRIKTLEEGEVALHDDSGSSVVLKRGGIVQVTAPTAVQFITPSITHNGKEIGSTHTHGAVVRGGELTDPVS